MGALEYQATSVQLSSELGQAAKLKARSSAMGQAAKGEQLGTDKVEATDDTVTVAPLDETPRRPYLPPRLRHLGSVRELTLGSGASAPDDESTQQV
jgi:hypothetical protein